MSGRALSWAYEQRTGSPTRKAVLAALADQANTDGLCWPGQATIAEALELHRATVNEALKVLEADGFITKTRRRRSNGSETSSVYQLHLDRVVQGDTGRVAENDTDSVGENDTAPPTPSRPERHLDPPGTEPPEDLAAKAAKGPKPKKEREPDLHFECLVLELGITDTSTLTKTSRGAINKALSEIKATGATPGDIRTRAREYRRKFPEAPLTAPALAKQWPLLTPARSRYSADNAPPKECPHGILLTGPDEKVGDGRSAACEICDEARAAIATDGDQIGQAGGAALAG